MVRTFYFLVGAFSLALGAIGTVVPLLPTVPFVILAAFCFARSSPALERRIVEHPVMKPHIAAWRERGAISRKGKRAALLAFVGSAIVGVVLLPFPALILPILAAVVGSTWISSRPTA